MSEEPASERTWYADVPRSAKIPTIIGFSILLISVFGFGGWASNAPIAGAAVAPGVFVATGENKIIQHLEGGIISEIAVKEGDIVETGQVLMRLDDTEPLTELRRLRLRNTRLKVVEARLHAEAEERSEIAYPPDIQMGDLDPDVRTILRSEEIVFSARHKMQVSRLKVLQQGINAFQEQMRGSELQLVAVHEQIKLINEELSDKIGLLEQGLVRKTEILTLQRGVARLQGEVGRLEGEIGNAHEKISSAHEEINSTRQKFVQDAVEELREVESNIHDVREQIKSRQDILDRINIIAPVEGIILKIHYNTSGGVIEPGRNIMDILPMGDELIIESRVRPQDIDSVQVGQEATIRLTALNRRVTPMVFGEVVYLSADTVPNPQSSMVEQETYIARIRLDGQVANEVPQFHPTPGMPAEVYIKTSERTFFEYLMRPIYDSMARAFRES